MSDNDTITAEVREELGKGAARAARRAGMVPGVVYGLDADPLSIAIDIRQVNRLINSGSFFSTLFTLIAGKETIKVLARDLQQHPVTDVAMHMDFLRVSADTAIAVEVQVTFINEETCRGLLDGGILNVVRYAVEVMCRPDAIPEEIVVDLEGFELGESVHISNVKLPDGVEPTITDRDFTIATIVAPAKLEEVETTDAEGEDGEGAQGEDGEDGEGEKKED
ncbi:MAG: 50S ribosomal protein L25/general stress protein Ctc [Alphaproteobacteria bacterium]|nr:50S ribosomal protein L25/general stress protein Ctc [Alphaproteobacteria bacterium]